jgi:hypothetical protein
MTSNSRLKATGESDGWIEKKRRPLRDSEEKIAGAGRHHQGPRRFVPPPHSPTHLPSPPSLAKEEQGKKRLRFNYALDEEAAS